MFPKERARGAVLVSKDTSNAQLQLKEEEETAHRLINKNCFNNINEQRVDIVCNQVVIKLFLDFFAHDVNIRYILDKCENYNEKRESQRVTRSKWKLKKKMIFVIKFRKL